MKARASKLPPELQKLVQEAVDRQMKEERGYIVLLTLQLSLWVMAAEYDWGQKRLEQLETLKGAGLLTDQEYKQKRQEIVKNL